MNDFAALYERYARDVFRFALFLSANHAEAEDITAETFLRAWTAAGDLRAATVKGYLMTIARNLHLQRLRRERRHAPLPVDVEDPRPDAHRDSENRAELTEVLRDLQELPEVDRAALLMHAEQEMPYAEIASALGLSLAAVKVKIHRARVRLVQMRLQKRGGTNDESHPRRDHRSAPGILFR